MRGLMVRDNLFNDLFEFRRDFDEIFDRMLNFRPFFKEQFPLVKAPASFVPAVEAYVDKETKKYVCRVLLPGIDPKEVEIHAQGNLLTIKGEKKFNKAVAEAEVHHSEFYYGSFNRTLTLPEGVLVENLVAEFTNGVLQITAPVALAGLPRKVEIKTIPIAKAA